MKQWMIAFSTFVKQHRPECMGYILFIGLAVFGLWVHEPAYDEAQAWMIAKTATWHDIFLLIPLYEGHPPFWHLLLAVPAKLGVSWHAAATGLGLLFMLANGFLLFFKAPFPRWVRCLLPFSYFLFFQYGIFVRPYTPLMTLLFLLAMYFPQKDKRPSLFIGLLALLCMCHLFGIAIAGGIVLAWLWEIKNGRSWKNYLLALYKDARFHKMFILLLWVIFIANLLVDPDGNIYQAIYTVSYVRQAIYVLLAMPAEAVLTNLDNSVHVTTALLPWAGLLGTACTGLLLWVLTLVFLPRKRILYLVLPYLCVSAIMLFYSSCHHIGVMLVLFIWYFWINLSQDPPQTNRPVWLCMLAKALLVLSLIIPISWTGHVLYQDYKLNLFDGQKIVDFLEKYNLTNEVIFAAWTMDHKGDSRYETNPNLQPMSVLVNMYLPRNLIANFHNGENKGYLDNYCPSPKNTFRLFQQWVDKGIPTVLLNPAPVSYLFKQPDLYKQYKAALLTKEYRLWKLNTPLVNPMAVYLHDDLWEKYKDQIIKEAAPSHIPQGVTRLHINLVKE